MCLAIPGEVVAMIERDGMRFANVRFGGIDREVCLEYQPEAKLGDFVLVHVGFAIATVNREEAARTLAILQELGEANLDEDRAS
jgi:hydrogenase expression/formation protein HypC